MAHEIFSGIFRRAGRKAGTRIAAALICNQAARRDDNKKNQSKCIFRACLRKYVAAARCVMMPTLPKPFIHL